MAEKYNKKSKFKFAYLLLIIVAVIVLAITIFAYKQRQNINAIYNAATVSAGDIQRQQEENNIKTNDILNRITDVEIKELPDDMRVKLADGEISKEQALGFILGVDEQTLKNSISENSVSGETKPKAEENITEQKNEDSQVKSEENNVKPEENNSDDKVSVGRKEEIIGEIYLLRAEFLNKIDALIESGKATVIATPKEELTLSKKLSLINSYRAKGAELEASCDARMEALLGELSGELNKSGESTAIVSEIREAYNEQKQIKKTELINKYSSYM